MHPTNCLNCGTLLTADDNFCPHCGQKSHIHRLSISHLLHEFFHAFTHADKGFLGLTADLAVRPGIVAREIIGGKRRKYFNPFTYFLLCIGILVFSGNVFKSYGEPLVADPRVMAKLPNQAARSNYTNLINRTNIGTKFIQKNLNLMTMLALPFHAFFYWIFFKRRGYNYAEFVVAFMLFSSFTMLLFSLLFFPFLGKLGKDSSFYYLSLVIFIVQFVYIGLAHYRFLQLKHPIKLVFTSLINLLSSFIIFLIMVLGQFIYIFRSNWWVVVKKSWQSLF